MRAVLYTDDMEPITVLELAPWAVEHLKSHRYITFAVIRPPKVCMPQPDEPFEPEPLWRVEIWQEIFIRKGQQHMFLFTHNDEFALLLKSAFLPGQWGAVREHERQAWGKGFIDALNFSARS